MPSVGEWENPAFSWQKSTPYAGNRIVLHTADGGDVKMGRYLPDIGHNTIRVSPMVVYDGDQHSHGISFPGLNVLPAAEPLALPSR